MRQFKRDADRLSTGSVVPGKPFSLLLFDVSNYLHRNSYRSEDFVQNLEKSEGKKKKHVCGRVIFFPVDLVPLLGIII